LPTSVRSRGSDPPSATLRKSLSTPFAVTCSDGPAHRGYRSFCCTGPIPAQRRSAPQVARTPRRIARRYRESARHRIPGNKTRVERLSHRASRDNLVNIFGVDPLRPGTARASGLDGFRLEISHGLAPSGDEPYRCGRARAALSGTSIRIVRSSITINPDCQEKNAKPVTVSVRRIPGGFRRAFLLKLLRSGY